MLWEFRGEKLYLRLGKSMNLVLKNDDPDEPSGRGGG